MLERTGEACGHEAHLLLGDATLTHAALAACSAESLVAALLCAGLVHRPLAHVWVPLRAVLRLLHERAEEVLCGRISGRAERGACGEMNLSRSLDHWVCRVEQVFDQCEPGRIPVAQSLLDRGILRTLLPVGELLELERGRGANPVRRLVEEVRDDCAARRLPDVVSEEWNSFCVLFLRRQDLRDLPLSPRSAREDRGVALKNPHQHQLALGLADRAGMESEHLDDGVDDVSVDHCFRQIHQVSRTLLALRGCGSRS